MATAIGLAANQSAGLRETHASNGSQYIAGPHRTLRPDGGVARRARLHRATTACSKARKGFGVSFASAPQFDAALEKLGESWEISTLAYKPYPSGFVIHPVTDACLEIAQNNSYDPAQIERIELAA